MAKVNLRAESTPALHREFRRFHKKAGTANILRAFLDWQRERDPERTYRFWADRWGLSWSSIAMGALEFDQQYRRPSPDNLGLFDDLEALAGITMREFFGIMPTGGKSIRAGTNEVKSRRAERGGKLEGSVPPRKRAASKKRATT